MEKNPYELKNLISPDTNWQGNPAILCTHSAQHWSHVAVCFTTIFIALHRATDFFDNYLTRKKKLFSEWSSPLTIHGCQWPCFINGEHKLYLVFSMNMYLHEHQHENDINEYWMVCISLCMMVYISLAVYACMWMHIHGYMNAYTWTQATTLTGCANSICIPHSNPRLQWLWMKESNPSIDEFLKVFHQDKWWPTIFRQRRWTKCDLPTLRNQDLLGHIANVDGYYACKPYGCVDAKKSVQWRLGFLWPSVWAPKSPWICPKIRHLVWSHVIVWWQLTHIQLTRFCLGIWLNNLVRVWDKFI